MKFRIVSRPSDWIGVTALVWNTHLGKDWVQSQHRFLDLIFFVQPFSCESGFQDQDQGPHPKGAQVNGKTLIVFSELWIRPQKLSHTLNGTLFEAKQAQGFIHVEVLTVKWNFPNTSCALLPASCCHFSRGDTCPGRTSWAQCLTQVSSACSLPFLYEIMAIGPKCRCPISPQECGEKHL